MNRSPESCVRLALLLAAALGFSAACGRDDRSAAGPVPDARPRASILLVTLDTTRADAIGPDAMNVETPGFNTLAARGRLFTQAYATAPETLPSHASMMTGLYPAGHGIHQNGRYLAADHPVVAERLQEAGYRTAAFVSSFVLARRFGIGRGFLDFDDEMPEGQAERSARATTDRAVAYLDGAGPEPLLLWVHYFDPHTPYAPPEPFREKYAGRFYHGEVAAMDEQLGRLVRAFEAHTSRHGAPAAILVAGDHGEGLGDHGELQHGNLLYQSTMRVPLVLVGPQIAPGVEEGPVSIRRVYHTLLDLAGIAAADSLNGARTEVVLGEAMKPFLSYGWQPQIMAVAAPHKAILAGRIEVYDVRADPGETHDLGAGAGLPPEVHRALREYPVPSPEASRVPETIGKEARETLASLGYVAATAPVVVRKDAPRPADMVHLFDLLERASRLFVEERYAEVVPLLERILAADPQNLDAALRLATAQSMLGRDGQAIKAFERAAAIAPGSNDVRTYLALHQARTRDWQKAVPLLEQVLAETPERLPALETLAELRERQGRPADALALRQRVQGLRPLRADELVRVGQLAMTLQRTPLAIETFEQARTLQGTAFRHDLELGVLYLDARRFEDARRALDRVSPSHPEYPMALFKRAQVSVLLKEPDRAAHVDRARRHADATTRQLIARERLFEGH